MRWTLLALSSSLLLACAGPSSKVTPKQDPPDQGVTIQVMTSDGSVPTVAHAHWNGQTREIDRGTLLLQPADIGAFAFLKITAVNHAPVEFPITAHRNVVTVRLGTYKQSPDFEGLSVLWIRPGQNFSFDSSRLLLVDSGLLEASIPWTKATIGYQLSDLVPGRTVNGPGNAFRYDGGGDYITEIASHAGFATVRLNTGELPRSGVASTRKWADPAGLNARLDELWTTHGEVLARAQAGGGESLATGSSIPAPLSAPERLTALARTIDGATDSLLKHAAMITYLGDPALDPKQANAAEYRQVLLADLPADSPLWAFAPLAPITLVQEGPVGADYVFALIKSVPSHGEVSELLFDLLGELKRNGDTKNLRRFHELARYRFSGEPWFGLLKRFDPDRSIAPGKQLPAFALPNADSSDLITDQTLRGKPYLLKFWATWCAPCLAQMPKLHELHKRFAPSGLVIVTVNIDDNREAFDAFRKQQWPMPWIHAFVSDSAPVYQLFEIGGLPTSILVGRDGIIAATSDELTAGAEETIAALLAKP